MDELARIEIDETAGAVVARVTGEVDTSNVEQAKRRLTDAVGSSAPGLVIDLSGTTYLDSSGVYLLFELARALEGRGQRLCVVAPPATPSTRVLLITGFDRIVPVTGTVDEALARVDGEVPAKPP